MENTDCTVHRIIPALDFVKLSGNILWDRLLNNRRVVVDVFFTLTDRASTIPSNIRGCQFST